MRESATHDDMAPSGFFALRTPLLPFDELLNWTNLTEATCDTEAARYSLRNFFVKPEVREALFVASPDFEERLQSWLERPRTEPDSKIERALLRYIVRMAGRPTPFGLFAGCSVGTIGRPTQLQVDGPCRRHTRLDMDYVVALVDALARDPHLRPILCFTPNSSLYHVAGRARYLEVRRQDKGWSHHRAALEVPDYLKVVLARAADGATPAALTQALLDHDPEATATEAAEYVEELIEQQVLVSELVPAVTGPEPIHGLIERLRQLPDGSAVAEQLTWVRDELADLDADGPGAHPDRYRAIAVRLAGLTAEVDTSRLFQVDLVRPAIGACLGENVVAEIVRGVELLRRLTTRSANDALDAFRRAFMARFGDSPVTGEIPLAEALDDETGIGFGDGGEIVEASALLEGLELSAPAEHRLAWGKREMDLLGRVTDALARGHQELVLTEKDLEELAVNKPRPLPDAFAVLARLEAVSDQAVARGDFRIYLASVSGPSGARLLGRFCHADPELTDQVERHLRAEERLRPDAVFAEIVHLPEGRLGNILARPACRDYEIPYLGRAGVPVERQLPISDLRVSVDGERIVLRSARLKREVLPRLTNAHDFRSGHSVYRFLCALQGQGVASGLGWDWGPLAGSVFLPRVVCGRLVLARARWRVTSTEVARLLGVNAQDRFAAVQSWSKERKLPRWVCLVESDNELAIDLNNRLMVETLLCQVKTRGSAELIEMFPAPDRLCALGPDGHYVHELVVPFVRQGQARVAPHHRSSAGLEASDSACRRVFPPGMHWLAIKLYAGPLTIDHLVRDVLGSLAVELVAEDLARRWFFVRYADPHGHLRLRFEGDPDRLTGDVLRRVQAAVAPLLADGRVWKVQLDTYEREIERYGGPAGIGLCEQLFHHDSQAAVELLRLHDNDNRGDRRWRLAFLGMDRLLDDLGLDLEGKRTVLERVRDTSRVAHQTLPELARRLGAKYRAESAALAGLIGSDRSTGSQWLAARAVLDRRSQGSALSTALLRSNAQLGRLTSSVADLAVSLLHMHANRLFRSAHQTQEMVLYDFLYRTYETAAARCSKRETDVRIPS